jgi:enamine deaminase RidA (YjgF/YER057c/UK114 family)
MSMPEFFNPTSVHKPLGLYSHGGVVRAGSEIVYIAGQVGVRADGTLPASIGEQADEAFANVVRVLAARDLGVANLVKINIYAVAGQPAEQIRAARTRHFGEHRPASTFVYVPQLVEAKYLIEVEGVAVR